VAMTASFRETTIIARFGSVRSKKS
jgi:hypothetical protein